MKKLTFIFALALALAACDKGEESTADAPEAGVAAADERGKTQVAPAIPPDSKKGTFSFAIDGEEKAFGHLPPKENMATSFSTMLLAKPHANAPEEFSINAMNFNAKTADLPATLELDLKKAMADPAVAAKAPKAIVQYISPDGVQYRAYATVSFASYADGMVKGTIADTELPTIKPKDKDKPPVLLTGFTFEVGI